MTTETLDRSKEQLKAQKHKKELRFHAVLAQSLNGVIGLNGGLPWHEPEDLKSFMKITMGGWLLMGRRTWEGLKGPLPGRQSIVLSRNRSLDLPKGTHLVHDLAGAIQLFPEKTQAFVIGGSQLYSACLFLLDEIWLTLIKMICQGDTHFNAFAHIAPEEWEIIEQRSLSPRAELFGLRRKKK